MSLKEAMREEGPRMPPSHPPGCLFGQKHERDLVPSLAMLLRSYVTGGRLISLGLSFPVCKMGTVTSILHKCQEDYMR